MHTINALKNSTIAPITTDAAQLDLFYDGLADTLAIASVSAINAEQACELSALQIGHYDERWPENAQLDLFINTPFDQALSALRRALLNNELEQAAKFYQNATELDAVRRREVVSGVAIEAVPSTNALSDAHICLQLLQSHEFSRNPRAEWAQLNSKDAVVQRFFGHESTQILHRLLRSLAARPELEAFDPAQANAYAAQIWYDLGEPELAKVVLERDSESKFCPYRLQLWTRVTWVLGRLQPALMQDCLRHWQRLCVAWPEHAEEALSQSAQFSDAWAAFCELDEPQPVTLFPAFASLNNIPWPQPDTQDTQPCIELIRVALALNADRNSVPKRLKLKALCPELFQYWMAKRIR